LSLGLSHLIGSRVASSADPDSAKRKYSSTYGALVAFWLSA
jgi:hypothetical protein